MYKETKSYSEITAEIMNIYRKYIKLFLLYPICCITIEFPILTIDLCGIFNLNVPSIIGYLSFALFYLNGLIISIIYGYLSIK